MMTLKDITVYTCWILIGHGPWVWHALYLFSVYYTAQVISTPASALSTALWHSCSTHRIRAALGESHPEKAQRVTKQNCGGYIIILNCYVSVQLEFRKQLFCVCLYSNSMCVRYLLLTLWKTAIVVDKMNKNLSSFCLVRWIWSYSLSNAEQFIC